MHQKQVCDAPSTSYIKNEREDSIHYSRAFHEDEDPLHSVGDVVWVNVRGNPLWPAMIAYPQNEFSHMRFKLDSHNMNNNSEYLSLTLDSNIKSETNIKDEPIETYDANLFDKSLNYDSMMHQKQVCDAPSTSYIKNEKEDKEDSIHYSRAFHENEVPLHSVGDIVWVNVRGNPLWPAMIAYPQDEFSHMRFKLGSSNNSSVSRQYHVQFFNDNERTMWVSSTSIILYLGPENLSLYLDKLKLNLKSGKTIKTSERNLLKALSKMGSLLTRKATNSKSLRWYRAVEEADEAVDMKMYERTRWFNSHLKEAKKKKSNESIGNSLDSETMSPSSHFKFELSSVPFSTNCKWETLSNTSDSSGEFSGFEEERGGSEITSQHSESFRSTQEVSSCASVSSSTSEQQECFITSKANTLWRCSKYSRKNQCNLNGYSLAHSKTVCGSKNMHKKSLKTPLVNHTDTKRFKCSECDYKTGRKKHLKTHARNHSRIFEAPRRSITEDLPKSNQPGKVAKNDEPKMNEKLSALVQKANLISDKNSCKNETDLFYRLEASTFPKVILTKLNPKVILSPQLQSSEFPSIDLKKVQKSDNDRRESESSTIEPRFSGNSDASPKTSDCERENSEKDNSSKEVNEKESDKMEKGFQQEKSCEETYSCSLCSYKTEKKSQFKRHHLIHLGRKLFKRAQCDYKCNYRSNMKVHLLTHSITKLFKCSECNYECNRKGTLKLHLLTHSNAKLFKCSECSYECYQKRSLKFHLLTHSNTKLFKCSECTYECNRKDSLKLHLLTHSNAKLFKCSECSYECNEKRSLKIHLLTHSNIKLFKCSECSYECNQKSSLKLHLLTHSNIKLFKCSECTYECNRKDNLKLHLLTHSNAKLFKCSECNYECNQKSSLKLHLLTHWNTKLFKCSECNFECNPKGSLKRHLLTHLNTKLFKCSECSYECNQKSSLKLHLLTHLNTKLFKCSECNFECNPKGSLKRHLLTHSNTKLFKCSECNYECNQKGHLKRHLLTHSNTKLFKCSECNYECNRKYYLKLHLLRH